VLFSQSSQIFRLINKPIKDNEKNIPENELLNKVIGCKKIVFSNSTKKRSLFGVSKFGKSKQLIINEILIKFYKINLFPINSVYSGSKIMAKLAK